MPESYSVAQVNQIVGSLLADDERLQDLWVQGEISGWRQYDSGHCYFTLKEAKAQLKCVMWRTAFMRQKLKPHDGDLVLAHGKVEVYPENGVYQLYADEFQSVGVGNLYLEYERLKAQLAAEGLFDPERKRPLPAFPRVIGVVTSEQAAAFQDVQKVLRERFPLAQVILAHTLVQGELAPPQIIRALRRLNDHPAVEVILVCRGGGSLEDLWAFNDEDVARAIAASRLPVVTGIGHETDFTLADFAADARGATPSAAVMLMTPDLAQYRARISYVVTLLEEQIDAALSNRADALMRLVRRIERETPQGLIDQQRQRVDEMSARLGLATAGRLALLRERLNGRATALAAHNPRAVLERGYAVVRREDGTAVTAAAQAPTGRRVQIEFYDGSVAARIEDTHD